MDGSGGAGQRRALLPDANPGSAQHILNRRGREVLSQWNHELCLPSTEFHSARRWRPSGAPALPVTPCCCKLAAGRYSGRFVSATGLGLRVAGASLGSLPGQVAFSPCSGDPAVVVQSSFKARQLSTPYLDLPNAQHYLGVRFRLTCSTCC